MRISLNWLKKYVDIKVSDEELVRLIGARLVEVEGVIDETHKYDNIYAVRVAEAEKIPNTHLTLCKIDAGDVKIPKVEKVDGLIEVLCGAPNVRVGMLAAWIAPGAIVPVSVNEPVPFVIGKRKMLGKYISNGMLAAADELDFGDNHDSIVEIDPEMAKPGDALADIFELNDLVLEIENKSLTHRPDCFGLIGFAREVAGILGEKFAGDFAGGVVKSIKEAHSGELSIDIVDSSICPRYSAIVLEKHGELKNKYLSWTDTILAKSGMKPISPIVDATNYLMLLTGQPLHAFDYDKFIKVGKSDQPKIIVRLAHKGEKLTLLDGKEVELSESDIVIASNDVPVALAGAMGGESTMIDEKTRNIIIESATFSLYNLRKTQMVHGIFSEAITRFTKGQPPYQTMRVAKKCAEMLADGFKETAMIDNYPNPPKQDIVKITVKEINTLLGTEYDRRLIVETLKNVNFEVGVSGEHLKIVAPEWRTDIHIKEDIIEEIGRLLGYDNIAPILPLHGTADKNKKFELKREIRNILSKYGANEVLTYSFVSERLLKKVRQDAKNSYKIVNSISPELQYIRQSIVPSLLEKTYVNEKLPVDKFAIFEMNQVYCKYLGVNKEKVPVEKNSLGLIVAERKGRGVAYYKAKKYVAKLLEEFGIKAEYLPIRHKVPEIMPFELKRAAEIVVDGEYFGVVGEFKNSVINEFKLTPYVAGFEIDLDLILQKRAHKKKIDFGEKISEDLTIETNKNYSEALKEVKAKYPEAEILPGSIYQAKEQKTKNMTFHIIKQN